MPENVENADGGFTRPQTEQAKREGEAISKQNIEEEGIVSQNAPILATKTQVKAQRMLRAKHFRLALDPPPLLETSPSLLVRGFL